MATASVNWIDKVVPTAQVEYSVTGPTNTAVTATLVNESEEITIINNNGSRDFTFTENGEFTFEFVDKVGNKGTAKAKVDWIVKEDEPIFNSSVYKIDGEYIYKIRAGITRPNMKEIPCTTVKEFKENVNTNQELTFMDKEGNAVNDEEIITTGMTIKVGKDKQYTLIVTGDVDGNGKISIGDFAKMKLHYVKLNTLTGNMFKAADINQDNNITVGDIAKMKLVLVGLTEKL